MAVLPITVTITLTGKPGHDYKAHLTGWALDDGQVYGSKWCLDMQLPGTLDKDSRAVLRALAAELELNTRPEASRG